MSGSRYINTSTKVNVLELLKFVDDFEENKEWSVQVFVIRHGQTDANLRHIIQGQMNTVLNDTGISQAKLCGEVLRDIQFNSVWSSDSSRCLQTRDNALGKQTDSLPNDLIHETHLFRERGFDEYEGKTAKEVQKLLAALGKTWDSFGEEPAALRLRLSEGWDILLKEARERKLRRVALFSHGGSISNLVHHLIKERSYELADSIPTSRINGGLNNTSITIVNVGFKDGVLSGTDNEGKYADWGVITEFNNCNHLNYSRVYSRSDITKSVEEEVVDNF
ncbi:histidine phosphatase superfamily [Dipodascopsis uninucleata]